MDDEIDEALNEAVAEFAAPGIAALAVQIVLMRTLRDRGAIEEVDIGLICGAAKTGLARISGLGADARAVQRAAAYIERLPLAIADDDPSRAN